MLASESGKNSLEKYKPQQDDGPDLDMSGQDAALAEAMALLYDILNASFTTSGTPLRGEWHGQDEDIQGVYWKCKELLEKINKDPEKTGFLAMSVIEHAWSMARALVLCPISKMLAGDMSMLENAKKLESILSDNVYKHIWAEKSGQYAAILKSIGFDASPEMFGDLTEIMDPLLDALTFYGPQKFGMSARIYRIRDGEPAPGGAPAIAKAICMFRSEKDLVDAVMASGKPRLMAFGAVEKTHAQVKDYFSEWFNGYPEERQRNMMRNENLTAEQYMAAPCDYTRAVYLCVKSGSACWLVHMPWRGDYMNRIGTAENEYTYGKRSSYAPYQIFYKSAPPAPAGSTMLAIPDAGHLLSELMDSQSMAWYPAFLDETMRLFFNKDGTYPDAQEFILPEETAAVIRPGGQDSGDACAVVPVFSGAPAVRSWDYTILAPAEVFDGDPDARMLFDYFGVSPDDIKNVPILPEKPGAPDAMSKTARERLKKAYLKILGMKISGLMADRWDARRWILDHVIPNMDEVVRLAGDGDLMPFMSMVVDGTPVLRPDGTPKMTTKSKYPYDPVPELVRTSPDDARPLCTSSPYKTFTKLVRWVSKPTSGRPPVVWKIRPAKAEDYAAMAGCGAEDLPKLLRLSGPMSAFYGKYKDAVPSDLSNQYACLRAESGPPGIYIPCFCAVNVCMAKRELKSFPYFAPGGKK